MRKYIWAAGMLLCAVGMAWAVLQYCEPATDDDSIVWLRQKIPGQMDAMQATAKLLREYQRQTGSFPTNEEGLSVLPDFLRRHPDPSFRLIPVSSSALTADNHERPYYWVGEGGVYPSHKVGLIYENRNGLPDSCFSSSPVNEDEKREASLEVAPGIYLCSLEGMPVIREHHRQQAVKRAYAVAAAIGGAGVAACAIPSGWILRILAVLALVWAITKAAEGPPATREMMISCYLMAVEPFGDPALMKEQDQLLEAYGKSGVLSAEAVAKIRARIARDQATMNDILKRVRGE